MAVLAVLAVTRLDVVEVCRLNDPIESKIKSRGPESPRSVRVRLVSETIFSFINLDVADHSSPYAKAGRAGVYWPRYMETCHRQ